MIISIFKSGRKQEMYLYVEKAKGLADVPDTLKEMFGAPSLAMTMLIKPDQKLARADPETVISSIQSQGYYLQLPPKIESLLVPPE
ncbi:MAG: YcgL domain-containing protein [Pseudomonadales bacterium]|nr:YcgL domain-containing protein [Pseudomonadales bacterium]